MASKSSYLGCVREAGLRGKYRDLWKGEVSRESLKSAAAPYGTCLFRTWSS